MRKQEIKEIKISDLKLWSENPREPLNHNTSDFDIIKNAATNSPEKWNLNKLMKQIGEFYDFSELPIVVEINGEYLVYDGNRRISIIKYLQNEQKFNKAGVKINNKNKSEFLELKKIPCNVCSLDVALDNIERKHTDNGTWNELERDYFKQIHRKEDKSLFIKIDEATKIITDNPKLNQGFVKKEVLTKTNLESIGFGLDENDEISTIYDKEFSKEIIGKIVEIINSKQITTRKNRGKLKEILENYDLSNDLGIYSNGVKKFTLKQVYLNTNLPDTTSLTSNSDASNSGTSNSGTSNSGTSNSGTSNSGTTNSGTSDSGTSNSGTSNSGTTALGISASSASTSGTPNSSTSSTTNTRYSIKSKPAPKRNGIPPRIVRLISECYNLDENLNPNAKLALTRVTFECILKYIVENTSKLNGKLLKESKNLRYAYYDKNHKQKKYVDFDTMKDKFTNAIKETGIKNAFSTFDLQLPHQIIHNYLTGATPQQALTTCENLIPLINFMLQKENELLDSLDENLL